MELYPLTHGAWSAVINLSRGANCISLRHRESGARILREPSYSPGEHPFLFGMPILFPVNRISGGHFTFEGREYSFPVNEEATGCHLHGGLHDVPFAKISGGEDHLLASYRADAAHPYGDFPHDFEVCMGYRLSDMGLSQTVTVINHSDTNMPCLLGFHTTFAVPFVDGGDVRVMAQIGEEYERGANYLPTGRICAPDAVTEELRTGQWDPMSAPLSRHCRAEGAGVMSLTDLRYGLRVVYENDAGLHFRLIYNGDANGFVCLEPQNCLVDAPNNVFGRERSGMVSIPPRERVVYHATIRLEKV